MDTTLSQAGTSSRKAGENFSSVMIAPALSDQWAPEHLEVQTADWRYYLDHCTNYENMLAHGISCRVRIEKYGG